MKLNVLTLFILCFSLSLRAATFTSATAGDWSDPATWGSSFVPSSGDTVTITGDDIISITGAGLNCSFIQLGSASGARKGNGTILFSNSGVLTVANSISFGDGGKSGYIDMTSGGHLSVGSYVGKKGSVTSGIGTIEFTNDFTLTSSANFVTFYDLIINSNLALSTGITVNNDIEIASGSLDVGGKDLSIKGDWINSGGTFLCGTGNETVSFDGTSIQYLGSETFNRIVINNSNHIGLTGNVTINDRVTFTTGNIILGDYNFILENTAGVADQSDASHAVTNGTGAFQMKWTTFNGKSFTFPLGDGTNYTPFLITVNTSAPAVPGINPLISVQVTDAVEPNQSEDDYLTRYWTVSVSDLTVTNYNWSAYYIQDDVVGVESNIYSYKYNGSWTEFNQADTINNFISGDNGTSFSSFTGKTGIIALPVELKRFDLSLIEDYVLLEWETAAEINNECFVVERSTDGTNWEVIDKVLGAGNSNVEIEYNSLDQMPTVGMNYYRLKQIDFDGSYEYSRIVSLRYKSEGEFSFYPNPVFQGDEVNLEGEGIISFKLFDSKGNLVLLQYDIQGSLILPTCNLSRGTYLGVIHNASGVHSVKLVVR